MVNYRVLTEDREFDDLRGAWSDLYERSQSPSITQSWEWMKTWWDVYGHDRKLFLVTGYIDNVLIGVAPLTVPSKKIRRLAVLNFRTMWMMCNGPTADRNVVSDYNGFIVENGKEQKFIRGLVLFLKSLPKWDDIVIEGLDGEGPVPELLGEAALESGLLCETLSELPSLLVKLPSTWEDFIESCGKNLRYQIRRGRRELEKLDYSVRYITHRDELEDGFRRLEKLHQERWRSKNTAGAFSSDTWVAFHKLLLKSVFDYGWVRLWFLTINGKDYAALYNFECGKRVHFYQTGFISHENKHIRPGLLIHSFAIQDAINRGMKEYDFLRVSAISGSGYKRHWANYERKLVDLRIARKTSKEIAYRRARKVVSAGKKWSYLRKTEKFLRRKRG